MEERDRLYSQPLSEIAPFAFGNEVVDVFDDMANRSIPGYENAVTLSAILTARFAQPSSCIYDLGCALGATAAAIAGQLQTPDCKIIGLDSSQAMIERARQKLKSLVAENRVQLQHTDIRQHDFNQASVVVSNFTLQFLPREDRQPLVKKIASQLHPQGAFLLTEKIHCKTKEDGLLRSLHDYFKRNQGYSDLEIAQKRIALETVMRLDTLQAHEERLKASGFSQVTSWFRCLNFVGLIALP